MKSMSWLLHENESSVLRECQACGFSTRSPSIYRRHSRHCDVSGSATLSSQESNGSSLASDFPGISSKPSADFPSVNSKLAMDIPNVGLDFPDVGSKPSVDYLDDHSAVSSKSSVDFPDVSREHSVGFPAIISQSEVINDNLLVFDADSDKVTVPSVEETASSQQSLEHGGTSMWEVDQALSEFLADPSQSLASTPADSSFHLTPVNPRSFSAGSVATSALGRGSRAETSEFLAGPSQSLTSTPADSSFHLTPVNPRSLSSGSGSLSAGSVATSAVDRGSRCETTAVEVPPDVVDDLSSADEHFDDGNSVNCEGEEGVTANKNKSDSSHVRVNEVSLSANTTDCDTKDIHNDDSKVVDSPEDSDQLETMTAGNTATTNESRDDTSPGLTGGKTQAKSKKLAQSRKSSASPSKQRRCKHCKLLLWSRLERRTHMQSKHADLIPVFRCKDCNYCSTEHKNYERHLLRHLLTGPFRCSQCTFSSTSQSSVKRHVALQHNQSQTTTDSVSRSKSSEISSGVSELPSTASSPAVNRSDVELISSPSDDTFGESLPSRSNERKKRKSENVNDSHGSASEVENYESKADVDRPALTEAATPDSSKDMIQSVIEVEVRSVPGEDGGEGETWWICQCCGARYDERAKVRRHVKCKHHIPLTQCRVRDLRSTPTTPDTSISSSCASDLIKQLQEARAPSSKVQAGAEVGRHSDTSEQNSVANKAGGSLVAPGGKLQPKSFVKIAPKPLQLDGGCQLTAAPTTAVVNSKRQVVLPKRNWKQMSLSLPPAHNVPESSSAVKDSESELCDVESELKRHLTQDVGGDQKLSSPVMQPVMRNEPENGVSPSLTPPVAEQEVPKKKRRLILRAKTNRTSQGPCDGAVTECSDSVKETNAHAECADVLPSEHAGNDDVKEQSNEMKDTTTEEPVSKVSESTDAQSKKDSTTKRQFGVKRTSPLKCAHCQFTAFRLPDLRRHLLEHTGDKVYECGRCARTFRNKIGLYLHEQRKHKADLTPVTSTSPTDENTLTAADAEQTSAKTEEVDSSGDGPKLKKKRRRNRSQKSSLRSQLEQELKEQSTYEVEKSTGNEDVNVTADPDEKCREKKDRSASKRCTETVEMVQSPDKSDHFKIVIRRQSSGGEEILETIAGVNNGMMCRFCGYMAKIPVQLSQHMKIHTGERDYWCTIDNCTYRTIWRCDMKRHFRKFHPDEVELHGGNYYELLQGCYRPSKRNDPTDSSLPTESSSSTVSVIKMSKRQRRRLLKLQSREQSKRCKKEEIPVGNKPSREGASSVVTTSTVASDAGEHLSLADSETKKENFVTKSVERFRPYKCSECGRRSNWRWDLKKHIQAKHKNAVIIKLNSDVARATFADIYLSHGGRNGIRFPRSQGLPDASMSKGSLPNDSKTEESGAEPDGKKPVSELEKTLARAPAPVKSIGMIDMLRLKRFQCSGCPYRSNHRGDLGRHIRMRHGRGNCTISVIAADVAAATLQAYRLQWNRKKAWQPKRDQLPSKQTRKMSSVKTLPKFRHSSRSAEKEEIAATVSETVEDGEKSAAEPEAVSEASMRKQKYKEFWYLDDGEDETKCCDMCPFKTDRTGLLELHKLRHRAPAAGTSSSSVTYSCPHCPYFVRTSRQLERHMALHEDLVQQHHDDPLPFSGGVHHISNCSSGKTRYVCEKCPFVSMFRNEFWLHRRQHFVPKVNVPYSCDLCPFWASDRRTLSEHYVLHTQSYYPRLSVPVVSPYRAANLQSGVDGTGGGNCSGEVTAVPGAKSEVVAEVDAGIQAETSLSRDDDVEMENCPRHTGRDDEDTEVVNCPRHTGRDDEDTEVENCPELEAVDDVEIDYCPRHTGRDDEDTEVENCPELEAVDDVEIDYCPRHTGRDDEDVEVENCPELEAVDDVEIDYCPRHTGRDDEDTEVENCPELEAVDDVEIDYCPRHTGRDDEDVEVENCPELEAVDQLMATVNCPRHTGRHDEDVEVENCPELEAVDQLMATVNCPRHTGRDDEDVEVENCPELEAVDQLMATVNEVDIPECCQLLEPECEQCFLESSIRERSVTCPVLISENPELTLPSRTGAESLDLGTGEVLLKDNSVVALGDGVRARESTDLERERADIAALSAESVTAVLSCSELAAVVTSDGDDVMNHKNDLSDDVVSSGDQTDSRDVKCHISDWQPRDACPTLHAGSRILTCLSGVVESSVMTGGDDGSLKDSRVEVLDDEVMPADCSDSVNTGEVVSCENSAVSGTTVVLADDNSAASDAGNDHTDSACLMSVVPCYQSLEALRDGVSDSTVDADRCDDDGLSKDDGQSAVNHIGSVDSDGLLKTGIDASDDGKPATETGEFEAEVSRDQIPAACSVGEDPAVVESRSLDADGRCDDDGLPKSHIGASDAGKPVTDLSESGECRAKSRVSNDRIPDASTMGEDGGKVDTKSLDDLPCRCALQCPYCFFAIASVRLLRQHMTFHVAVSDAATTPVFQPQLDCVEDGRMDDVRCEHLVQLCNRCRHLAELDSPVAIPETADTLVRWGNCDPVWGLGNAGGVTVSELADKTAFLSQLSLAACHVK